jgi:hypothetical protein
LVRKREIDAGDLDDHLPEGLPDWRDRENVVAHRLD